MKIDTQNSYIVMTPDVLQGSPRLDGRRLAVGDIVSWVDSSENLSEFLKEFELSIAQVKECLIYCKNRKCIADAPNKFCHNCTLRVQQDNDDIDEEQDNWLRAEKAFCKYFQQDSEDTDL